MRSSVVVMCLVIVGCVRGISVDERLSELERVIILQAETLSQHESLIREQRDQLEHVLQENNILKTRICVLENALEQSHDLRHGDDVDKVEGNNIREVDTDQQRASGNVHMRRDTSLKSGEDWTKLQDRQHRRQTVNSASTENVAFYAHSLGTKCLHDNDTLVFDGVDIDVGNGYNKNDGIYMVPLTGTYVFTWSITARGDWYTAELVVNGDVRGRADVNSVSSTTFSNARGLIVTHVTAGDRVYIRRSVGTGCNVDYYIDASLPTFAGWLLF